jgi:hypothetical protein
MDACYILVWADTDLHLRVVESMLPASRRNGSRRQNSASPSSGSITRTTPRRVGLPTCRPGISLARSRARLLCDCGTATQCLSGAALAGGAKAVDEPRSTSRAV